MASQHLIRLRSETLWPDGHNRLWLEVKRANRRSYELVAAIDQRGHLTNAGVEPLLEQMRDLIYDVMADGGLGAEYLPLWGVDPL